MLKLGQPVSFEDPEGKIVLAHFICNLSWTGDKYYCTIQRIDGKGWGVIDVPRRDFNLNLLNFCAAFGYTTNLWNICTDELRSCDDI